MPHLHPFSHTFPGIPIQARRWQISMGGAKPPKFPKITSFCKGPPLPPYKKFPHGGAWPPSPPPLSDGLVPISQKKQKQPLISFLSPVSTFLQFIRLDIDSYGRQNPKCSQGRRWETFRGVGTPQLKLRTNHKGPPCELCGVLGLGGADAPTAPSSSATPVATPVNTPATPLFARNVRFLGVYTRPAPCPPKVILEILPLLFGSNRMGCLKLEKQSQEWNR